MNNSTPPALPESTAPGALPESVAQDDLPEEPSKIVISHEYVHFVVQQNWEVYSRCVDMLDETVWVTIDWTIGDNGYPKEVIVKGDKLSENFKTCLSEQIKTIYFDRLWKGKRFLHKYRVPVGTELQT